MNHSVVYDSFRQRSISGNDTFSKGGRAERNTFLSNLTSLTNENICIYSNTDH